MVAVLRKPSEVLQKGSEEFEDFSLLPVELRVLCPLNEVLEFFRRSYF